MKISILADKLPLNGVPDKLLHLIVKTLFSTFVLVITALLALLNCAIVFRIVLEYAPAMLEALTVPVPSLKEITCSETTRVVFLSEPITILFNKEEFCERKGTGNEGGIKEKMFYKNRKEIHMEIRAGP